MREDESQYLMLKMVLSDLLDPRESEKYNYHILLDHLRGDLHWLMFMPQILTLKLYGP